MQSSLALSRSGGRKKQTMTGLLWLIFFLQAAAFYPTPSTGREVCYERLGCFSDLPPFDDVFFALPQSPQEIDTKFRLYTRQTTSNEGEILDPTVPLSITNSTFITRTQVTMIVHGFSQDGLTDWVRSMRQALLIKKNMNVIVVDWGRGSALFNLYDVAAGNTRLVGAQVGEMIHLLHRRFKVKVKHFHVIGHSLGAQIAGFAGAEMLKRGKRIGRITGLDPARPGFDVDDTRVRLDPNDAAFVDVMHTDAGGLLGLEVSSSGGLGLYRPSGHVDFYPNGGKKQPGCHGIIGDLFVEALLRRNPSLPQIAACNHMKAVSYFTASITCPMKAYPCSSWEEFEQGRCFNCNGTCQQMGYNAGQQQHRGNESVKAFLVTNEQRPFCVSDSYYSVEVSTSEATQNVFTYWMMPMTSLVQNKLKITLIGDKGEDKLGEERGVSAGTQSFLATTKRSVGSLTSLRIDYQGSALYLGKVIVRSAEDGMTYTACFNKEMTFSMFGGSMSYERSLVRGDLDC